VNIPPAGECPRAYRGRLLIHMDPHIRKIFSECSFHLAHDIHWERRSRPGRAPDLPIVGGGGLQGDMVEAISIAMNLGEPCLDIRLSGSRVGHCPGESAGLCQRRGNKWRSDLCMR
jgi:hypothetical protein